MSSTRTSNGSRRPDDHDLAVRLDSTRSAAIEPNLGPGRDTVELKDRDRDQIRLTFDLALDGTPDFTITLANGATPLATDHIS